MDESEFPKEQIALRRLQKLVPMLAEALQSLGEKAPPSPESYYVGSMSRQVLVAAEGYNVLRKAGYFPASKLMIRSALEMLFNLGAVLKKKGFLYWKAYWEYEEQRRLFKTDEQLAALTQAQNDISAKCTLNCPGYVIDRKQKPGAKTTARDAGLEPLYLDYLLYCNYQHGAADAVEGRLDELSDRQDTDLVATCVLLTLVLLKNETPAVVGDYAAISKELYPSSST